ncbi:hypothetical protein CRG98_029985 [Punica granatum]|uniref:Uncharacterized protein n=1 Tax=Punica granatum TaxID=22663 RepID=A0A2I0J077_PUNGR|nr:hypothetical protein CRG98_029985 [Punica granatum]
MMVLPKWLRRGTPTIPGHPVIMRPPGFHRATQRNREGISSRQKRLHSEKLCSGGGMTGAKRSISERSSAIPQEDPVYRSLGEHDHVSDDVLDECVVHRPESPLDAHDVLPWRRDCFEPKTGSRAVHPYLDGGDAGLTFLESNQCNVLSLF